MACWSPPWVSPRQTFDGQDLYPGLFEKAVALGFSLIKNHPFVDGNTGIGHATVEAMLMLNGMELDADIVLVCRNTAGGIESRYAIA